MSWARKGGWWWRARSLFCVIIPSFETNIPQTVWWWPFLPLSFQSPSNIISEQTWVFLFFIFHEIRSSWGRNLSSNAYSWWRSTRVFSIGKQKEIISSIIGFEGVRADMMWRRVIFNFNDRAWWCRKSCCFKIVFTATADILRLGLTAGVLVIQGIRSTWFILANDVLP